MPVLWVFICTVYLTVCYYHVTYEFQSESTLCSLPECQGRPCSKQAPYLNKLRIWRLLWATQSRCCHWNFRYGFLSKRFKLKGERTESMWHTFCFWILLNEFYMFIQWLLITQVMRCIERAVMFTKCIARTVFFPWETWIWIKIMLPKWNLLNLPELVQH